jgi:ubiquinone/menaquinone biosynthesis C-methylase UbiE
MSVYVDRISPHLTHFCCGSGRIRAQRAKIVPEAAGVVVEIGFGSGHNLPLYDPVRVSRVVGIEPNETMRGLAAGNLRETAVPVTLLPGVGEAIPLDDRSADTAVLTYTLCSVAEPEMALCELRRVLKPGGRLLVLEHGRSEEAGVARWQDRLDPLWTRLAAGCHINRPTRSLIEAAGFSFERIETFYLPWAPKPLVWHSRGIGVVR